MGVTAPEEIDTKAASHTETTTGYSPSVVPHIDLSENTNSCFLKHIK